ncbi:hypothetical protein Tco_1223075, partial [Tanacetum coccineum]
SLDEWRFFGSLEANGWKKLKKSRNSFWALDSQECYCHEGSHKVISYANDGEPSVIFGRDFLVTSESSVDFGIGEIDIDLTMFEEMKDIYVMLDALIKNSDEVGSSNGDLVKMGKASRNKNHNVNKLTPSPQLKFEEIPPISAIAPPSPIYHPLTQEQKDLKILFDPDLPHLILPEFEHGKLSQSIVLSILQLHYF